MPLPTPPHRSPAHQPPAPPAESPQLGQPWRPRFNLFTLMLVMFVISVLGAGLYYVLQAMRTEDENGGFALMFMLAAPLVLMVLVSVAWQVYRFARGDENDE